VLTATAALGVSACTIGGPDDEPGSGPPNLPPPPSPTASPSPSGGPGGSEVGVQVLASGLAVPWGMTFLPDGSALVTERDTARILQVKPSGQVTPVQTLAEVEGTGEGGLLGIAASPKYAQDKTVYVYYSTRNDNRIASLVLGQRPKPIVTGIPSFRIHNGGRLAFGPDGYLYAGTGDASQGARSQNKANLGGKILRMTTAGKPAPGNPIPGSLVWSYGHRNVQGLAWDSQKRMYATEFGQNKFDEVNLVRPNVNYGWPAVEGTGTDKRYVNPLITWTTAEASPSGAAVVGSGQGQVLIVAALRGTRLWLAQLNGKGGITGKPMAMLQGEYGRLRTVVPAPDGSVWVTTSNRDSNGTPGPDDDRILRLVFPGSGGASII
jgi:glucose/arabinose dehydrogenase